MSVELWGLSEAKIFEKAFASLQDVTSGICQSHGLDHGKAVMDHAKKALAVHLSPISDENRILILLAALLHDADDYKFFSTKEGEDSNAERILVACSNDQITTEQIKFVSMLIDFVSCSKNHNDIPPEALDHPEYLYPRHADRLEAIGDIGARRCYEYTKTKGSPFFVESTPRPQNMEELERLIDPERFQAYKGGSDSMIDHYYDKLLHLSNFSSGNKYLDEEASQRGLLMKEICLYYAQHGALHPCLLEQ